MFEPSHWTSQKLKRIAPILLLVIGAVAAPSHCDDTPRRRSTTPVPQAGEWADSWWTPRHQEKLAQIEKSGDEIEVVMIGDSITQFWEKQGRAAFYTHYWHRNVLNLGFSADGTENVLWRLQHGEIDGISPQLVILLIGTNNIHRGTPTVVEDTAAGVGAVLDEIKRRLPEAKILLLAMFPRGAAPDHPLRKLVVAANEQIESHADGEQVIWLDINKSFLSPSGIPLDRLMPDRLHLSREGYEVWAAAMEPRVRELLGEEPLGKP